MSRIRDALDRWRAAERALAAAEPGTPDERRARAAYADARATYQALMDDDVAGHQAPAGPDPDVPEDDAASLSPAREAPDMS